MSAPCLGNAAADKAAEAAAHAETRAAEALRIEKQEQLEELWRFAMDTEAYPGTPEFLEEAAKLIKERKWNRKLLGEFAAHTAWKQDEVALDDVFFKIFSSGHEPGTPSFWIETSDMMRQLQFPARLKKEFKPFALKKIESHMASGGYGRDRVAEFLAGVPPGREDQNQHAVQHTGLLGLVEETGPSVGQPRH